MMDMVGDLVWYLAPTLPFSTNTTFQPDIPPYWTIWTNLTHIPTPYLPYQTVRYHSLPW